MAKGRKRKNVSSSEEEESSSEESVLSEEEEEESSEEELDSDDEDVKPKKKRGKSAAAAKKKGKAPPKKTAKTTAGKGRAAVKKKPIVVQEEEEEFGSVPVQQTQQNDEDEHDPGFGEDLIIDEQDRLYLNSLSEMDREQVLSERYEKLQRWKEWKALRGQQQQQQTSSSASSRKAAAAQAKAVMAGIESDEEDDSAKRTKKPSAQAAASQAQQLQGQQQSRAESEEEEEEEASEEEERLGFRFARDEEEDEDAPPPDESPIDLRAAQEIFLTRSQILSWIDYPKFRAGLLGCLIKVSADELGPDQYVLKEIVKVEVRDVQPYIVDQEPVMFVLKTRGGAKNKLVLDSLAKVSNKPLTQQEFDVYQRLSPLSKMNKHEAQQISKHLRSNLSQFVISGEHVLQMVEAKKYRRGDHSVLSRSLGLNLVGKKKALTQEIHECNRQRDKLARQLEKASTESSTGGKKGDSSSEDEDDDEDGNMDKEGRIRRILDDLKAVNDKLDQLESEQKKVEAAIAKESEKRLAKEVSYRVNERNMAKNRDTLFKVEQKKRQSVENNPTGGTGNLNPFLRRPTRPQMMWATDQKKEQQQSENAPVASNEKASSATSTTSKQTLDSTGGGAHANASTTEGRKDETFVEDLTLPTDVRPQQARLRVDPEAAIAKSTATKKFSLEEYRRMKKGKA